MAVVATFDGTANVTVSTFDPAVDQVQLALAVTAIASVAQRGTDIVITSASGFTLTIEDTQLAELVQGAAGSLPLFGGGTFFVGDGTVSTVPDPLANVIAGTAASDVMMGLQGNDTIDAAATPGGSDLIYAGAGNDMVTVDDNNDPAAATRVNGGTGNDTIDVVMAGSASIGAGSGGDFVIVLGGGTASALKVQGGQGNDTIDAIAFFGSATVGGGQGDDFIAVNVSTGEAGSVLGGLGADTIDVSADGPATVFGSDPSANAADDGDLISVIISSSTTPILVNGFGGNDSLGAVLGTGSVGGGQGDDWIDVFFLTGGGSVVGGLGADTMMVGAFLDVTVNGSNASGDSVDGGDFVDVFGSGDNAASVRTGYGDDTVSADLVAAATIKAGAGNDVVEVCGCVLTAEVSTGGGNDSVLAISNLMEVAHAYTLGSGADTIAIELDGAVAALYTITDFSSEDVAILNTMPVGIATAGGALVLDDGADSVSFAGAADDLVTVDIDWPGLGDFIRNGGSAATLAGTSDADLILSVFSKDTIVGGGGADTLQGGLDDNLFVETGPQITVPGLSINGGGGSDTVQISGGFSLNLVADSVSITDVDAFNLSGTSNVSLTLDVGTFSFGGGTVDASALAAGAGLTLDALSSSAVTVHGSAAADDILGSTFDDSVTGGQGSDAIDGDVGRDTIAGGQGNDSIDGCDDADRLTGGAGNNTFLYDDIAFITQETGTTDATADTITDFATANDTIAGMGLAGAGNYAEAIVASSVNTVTKAVAAYQDGIIGTDQAYTFFTNGTDGYLIIDDGADGTAEGAILLTGLGSLSDFDAANIIANIV
jgi:Ca2+-binding RTX toxin-like protein